MLVSDTVIHQSIHIDDKPFKAKMTDHSAIIATFSIPNKRSKPVRQVNTMRQLTALEQKFLLPDDHIRNHSKRGETDFDTPDLVPHDLPELHGSDSDSDSDSESDTDFEDDDDDPRPADTQKFLNINSAEPTTAPTARPEPIPELLSDSDDDDDEEPYNFWRDLNQMGRRQGKLAARKWKRKNRDKYRALCKRHTSVNILWTACNI